MFLKFFLFCFDIIKVNRYTDLDSNLLRWHTVVADTSSEGTCVRVESDFIFEYYLWLILTIFVLIWLKSK